MTSKLPRGSGTRVLYLFPTQGQQVILHPCNSTTSLGKHPLYPRAKRGLTVPILKPKKLWRYCPLFLQLSGQDYRENVKWDPHINNPLVHKRHEHSSQHIHTLRHNKHCHICGSIPRSGGSRYAIQETLIKQGIRGKLLAWIGDFFRN